MGQALDAARGGRLRLQPVFGDAAAAAFANPPYSSSRVLATFRLEGHHARDEPATRSRTISRQMPIAIPTKLIAVAAAVIVLAGCQPGSNPHPVPSVAQLGSDLKCAAGDHPFEDPQAGWGFCYPGTWRYELRAQGSQSPAPAELDLTFDITDIPCAPASPGGGSPVCSPDAGLFAFMIVSTFERGASANLAAWEASNLNPAPDSQPILWGNSVEAARFADGRRIALTPNHVVILDLHSGQGHLDLETEMSARLDTWKFSY